MRFPPRLEPSYPTTMSPSNQRRSLASIVCFLSFGYGWACIGNSLQAEEPIRFNRDIRPILSDNCFYCHGPDRNKRQADLRLDTETGLKGSDGEPGAIVPGNPDASHLMHRILSHDAQEKMPPPESGKSLTEAQVALLKRWIAEGGNFEGHWSFLPRPNASVLSNTRGQPRSDAEASAQIDARVARDLASHNLSLAPEADKVTLLRRLQFDLVGLPPTEQEIAAFLADDSSHAYERQVDRLLASPHFGERMAIWWLDLVRYADSVGYHGDQEVSVSPFRQYVIDAFNGNKPFDQFTVEQLAGDLLPNPTREQRIASGYNRLGMMSAEGGVQDKEYLAKYMAERVRNVSGAWMGITLGCAECHDHKFDPLSTRDFYRMGAFFADIKERGLYSGANSDGNWGSYIPVPTQEQETRLAELERELATVHSELNAPTDALRKSQEDWESQRLHWSVLRPRTMTSIAGVTLRSQPDGSVLASGLNPLTDTYTMTYDALPAPMSALRLDVLPDDSFPQRGPGRAGNGNFVLTEVVVQVQHPQRETRTIDFKQAKASFEQTGAAGNNPYGKWAVDALIDRDAKGRTWGWAIMEQAGRRQTALLEFANPLKLEEGESLVVSLWQNHDASPHTLGRFRLSAAVSNQAAPGTPAIESANALADLPPAEVEEALETTLTERTEAQKERITTYYRSIAPELAPWREKRDALERAKNELKAQWTTTLVTESVPPRMVRMLPRGNWMDESGDVVEPGIPESLGTIAVQDRRANRLDLARWIVAPSNPLTSRALSNRLWKVFFGAGLSRKLDDLGAQGEWPTHPELLDEISQWWIDTGWDMKRWIKIVVMSKTYRQSSHAADTLRQYDPYNRLLARQSSFRLDAELVRDNALAVSGLLVTKLGGRSVRPYQPPGYWAYLNFPQREWQNGNGDELYRRGLYTHWQRQYLHPSLLVFDAPSREECTADRPRSNTPLQSLALLNDPTYVEAARAFSELILRHSNQDSERLNYAFQRALSRDIQPAEREILQALLDKQREAYRKDPEAARQVLTNGARPSASDLDPAELASWTAVARSILNLHEAITRY